MKMDHSYDIARERMVEEQLLERNIRNPRVLEAMRTVPRHSFVPVDQRGLAYVDSPLPIGSGQTISQPYIVALMTQLLELRGDERVLEVGTGSGYQAAVLAYLAADVFTIERHADLGRYAARILEDLGYKNVHVEIGDGSRGLAEYAPFDAILVTAAAPRVPRPLLQQLANGGRLVIPVGARGNQTLERWIRNENEYVNDMITAVAFVPLLGEFGWQE